MQAAKTRGHPGTPPDTCPRCGARDVIPISYGFPRNDWDEAYGGLYVAYDSPGRHCRECGHEFGRFDPEC